VHEDVHAKGQRKMGRVQQRRRVWRRLYHRWRMEAEASTHQSANGQRKGM
jgi:hypothetical protein